MSAFGSASGVIHRGIACFHAQIESVAGFGKQGKIFSGFPNFTAVSWLLKTGRLLMYVRVSSSDCYWPGSAGQALLTDVGLQP